MPNNWESAMTLGIILRDCLVDICVPCASAPYEFGSSTPPRPCVATKEAVRFNTADARKAVHL
jgi:hypothetical protein